MRFEAKHQLIKQIYRRSGKKNIAKTIAKTMSEHNIYSLQSLKGSKPQLERKGRVVIFDGKKFTNGSIVATSDSFYQVQSMDEECAICNKISHGSLDNFLLGYKILSIDDIAVSIEYKDVKSTGQCYSYNDEKYIVFNEFIPYLYIVKKSRAIFLIRGWVVARTLQYPTACSKWHKFRVSLPNSSDTSNISWDIVISAPKIDASVTIGCPPAYTKTWPSFLTT